MTEKGMTLERQLASFLRHYDNDQYDSHGWREVRDLVEKHVFLFIELKHIVSTNNKQWFEFSEDGQFIRACQGHSVNVDVELEVTKPIENSDATEQ